MQKVATIFTLGILLAAGGAFAQPAIDWQKNFQGGSSNYKSEFNAVIATADGGYIAVGKGWGSAGDLPNGYIDHGDALIIKTAADGTVQWSDYWGQQEEDAAMSVIQTADGGYVVAGYTAHFSTLSMGGNDGFVVKYNAAGTIQWEHIYGGSGHDLIYSICQTSDGGYAFVGSTKSPEVSGYHGGSDLWVAKIDATGTEVWSKAKGYSGEEAANSVTLASDGGFIIAGKTNSPGAVNYKGGYDIWVMKVTTNSNIDWQTCVGGTKDDAGSSVLVAADGSIWLAGRTKSNDSDISGNHSNDKNDLVLAHLDAAGTLINTKVFGGTSDDATGFTDNQSIKQTSDGGFVMLTSTLSNDGDVSGNHGSYDFWLLKANAAGNLEWQQCIGGGTQDYANALDLTADGGYILAGQYNTSNAWLIRVKGTPSDIENLADQAALAIYPNPVSGILNIFIDWEKPQSSTLTVYDITGRALIMQTMDKGNRMQTQIDISALPAGSYYLKIATSEAQMAKSFQVVR